MPFWLSQVNFVISDINVVDVAPHELIKFSRASLVSARTDDG